MVCLPGYEQVHGGYHLDCGVSGCTLQDLVRKVEVELHMKFAETPRISHKLIPLTSERIESWYKK